MNSEISIDSECSTIPNTPETDSENVLRLDQGEVFAWLRPLNGLAQKAFDATINTVIKHSPTFDDYRPFLHCDSRQIRSQSDFSEDDIFETDRPSCPIYGWAGAFGLRLTHLPHDPVQGWCMGTGYARTPSKPVDMLLAPPKNHLLKNTRIASHHATLQIHRPSCRVSLHARHTVKISRNGAKTFRRSASFLLEPGEIVFLGEWAYTFEYTQYFQSLAFQDAITHYVWNYHEPQWTMNPHISPSSIGLPTALGDYYCSPTAFDQGTYGRIRAGWSNGGETVAIKTFKNLNESELRLHDQLMRYIGRHVRYERVPKNVSKQSCRRTSPNYCSVCIVLMSRSQMLTVYMRLSQLQIFRKWSAHTRLISTQKKNLSAPSAATNNFK